MVELVENEDNINDLMFSHQYVAEEFGMKMGFAPDKTAILAPQDIASKIKNDTQAKIVQVYPYPGVNI